MFHNNKVNENDVELDMVSEECNECKKRMTNIKFIFTSLDDGNYYCKSCVNTYGINAVKCLDID